MGTKQHSRAHQTSDFSFGASVYSRAEQARPLDVEASARDNCGSDHRCCSPSRSPMPQARLSLFLHRLIYLGSQASRRPSSSPHASPDAARTRFVGHPLPSVSLLTPPCLRSALRSPGGALSFALHYYCKLCRNLRCSLPGVWRRLVEAQVDEVRVHDDVAEGVVSVTPSNMHAPPRS